jgi:hypothetical protein
LLAIRNKWGLITTASPHPFYSSILEGHIVKNAKQQYQARTMQYYDLKNNWRRVKPHLGDQTLNDILVRDFNKYTIGRWGEEFTYGDMPADFESCDWNYRHRGRHPAFWKYVKHAACHWLVNFSLRLATLAAPERTWRIVTSKEHSTVWDGECALFDFNLQAIGVDPNECFELAYKKVLKPGKYLKVHFAEHYSFGR